LENNKNLPTPEYLHAEKTALRLIARAEQCSAGLARKLKKRKHDTAVINEVISSLIEQNLLDDNRFACLWLQSRLHFTRSPRQLLSSLCARGLDHSDAKSALQTVLDEETEFALLERYARKYRKKLSKKKARYNGSKNSEDLNITLKFMLKNEGFSLQAIHRLLQE
jgi:regulatory protein